jgi:quercetin dioxygenase-like cupin family protein
MKQIALSAGLVLGAAPLAGALAQGLSPAPIYEGSTTVSVQNGASKQIHVKVESWDIAGQNHSAHEVPLRGFYLAHLLSGEISATIDGQMTNHAPGDYWTVKPGATMQVKVLGEFAVLETTILLDR